MPTAFRLVKTRYLATAWDGGGAKRAGGRWNSPGVAVVYTSASLSLALVEVLVHLPSGILPAYSAIPVEFEDRLIATLQSRQLPANWSVQPAPVETRERGDAWVRSTESVVLKVPSVVVPTESNYLINPGHPDFKRLKIGAPLAFPFDARLAGR